MLENGAVFEGQAAGKFKETVCELVFNTSMTGYVEMLSDPSNAGLGVVMTYPLIGNYGVCLEDMESDRLYPAALLVHELCDTPSNFRSEMTLEELLIKYEIPCIKGLDNRAIVMNLRENGAMKAIITDDISNKDALSDKINAFGIKNDYKGADEKLSDDGISLAFVDFGARKSFIDAFAKRGFAVSAFSVLNADEIIAKGFEGVVLSNGVEDFDTLAYTIEEIEKLMDKNVPIFAIGLGHQLVALANGGKVEKMLHGHRGCNYPVRFNHMDKTYITAQNHGYAVTEAPANADVLCSNVNDNTIEGFKYKNKPVITVQFIPDTAKGPNTAFLFDDFKNIIKEGK